MTDHEKNLIKAKKEYKRGVFFIGVISSKEYESTGNITLAIDGTIYDSVTTGVIFAATTGQWAERPLSFNSTLGDI